LKGTKMMSYLIDATTWTSSDKVINDFLKTHDSFSIVKDVMDTDGKIKKGVFTFEKNNKELMWTLTVVEDFNLHNTVSIEIGEQ
jgi:hypothetical protein